MNRLVWMCIGCWAAACGVWAQAQPSGACGLQVHGLAQAADGSPLAGATVQLLETRQGGLADAEGHFLLRGICPGTYTLQVTYVGLQPQRQRIQVQRSADVSFTLMPDSTEMAEVRIVGLPSPRPESSQSLEGEALLRTRGENLATALTQLPGVSMLQTGPTVAKPVVHGLTGNRVLILNNGIRHEGQQWGAEHAPEIDPFLATRLTVVRGAASIRYGADAIGGVVLVEPPALPDSLGTMRGQVNGMYFTNGRMGAAAAQLEAAPSWAQGWAWRLQGSWKDGGDFRTPDYWLANTAIRERNFSGALGYTRGSWHAETFFSNFDTQVGIIRWAHVGNFDERQRIIERGGPTSVQAQPFSRDLQGPWQDVEHQLSKTQLRWTAPWATWQLIYAYQRNYRAEYDRHRYVIINGQFVDRPEPTPAMTFTLQTHTADLIAGHTTGVWTWETGLQALHQDNTYGGAELIPFFRQRAVGGYALLRLTREHWTYEGAARYDTRLLDNIWSVGRGQVDRTHDFNGWSGNLGAAWTAHDGTVLRLQAATHWRAPNINELYSRGVHHGTATFEEGDANLQPERSYSLVATLETPADRSWQVRVSPYLKRIDNFIQLIWPGPDTLFREGRTLPPFRTTIRGVFPVLYYVSYDTDVYGLDLNARWDPHPRWQLRAAGSMVRMRNAETNAWLPFVPADQVRLSLRHRLPDKARRSNTFLELEALAVDRQTRAPLEADFAEPPPGFVRLDLTLGTTMRIARQPLVWQVSVQNLLNTRYRDYLDRLRYYALAPGIGAVIRLQVPLTF